MKKNFKLTDPKKVPARHVETLKHEIKKYIARERRKKLSEGSEFWDFDCRLGSTEESAKDIHISEINKSIDEQVRLGSVGFYLEILAKPGHRSVKKK